MDWKTPSPIVERQMLPRQTKSTEIGSGIVFEWERVREGEVKAVR